MLGEFASKMTAVGPVDIQRALRINVFVGGARKIPDSGHTVRGS